MRMPEAPNQASDIVGLLKSDTHIIVPLANGEPTAVLDAIENAVEADMVSDSDRFMAQRVHQMHAIHDRRYLHGDFSRRLHHISYFLSHVTRPHFRRGAINLMPAHSVRMSGPAWRRVPGAGCLDSRLARSALAHSKLIVGGAWPNSATPPCKNGIGDSSTSHTPTTAQS